MKRNMPQLFITIVAILIAALMITSVSYAWIVLSSAPEAQGISVSIGGGTTILIAPDVTGTDANGEVYHHPGSFAATLNFSQNEIYRALGASGALTPVSTADGEHWYTQAYDQYGDPAGFVEAGEGWLCFDVWVVSPGGDYDLRVSTDKNTHEGSYLVELPDIALNEETGEYYLDETTSLSAASARVGFLVNTEGVLGQDMYVYMNTDGYEARYWKLQGRYDDGANPGSTSFLIYEPNGTLHSGETNGTYLETWPLGADGESTDVSSHLTVQDSSYLNRSLLQAPLNACMFGQENLSAGQARERFYRQYLQGQLDAYMTSGLFLRSASEPSLGYAGAAEDAVITTLHKNVPQRIRVFLWLEGQDPDCNATGLVSSSELVLKLELAGASR